MKIEHETLPQLPCCVLSHGGGKRKENVRQFAGRNGIAQAAGDFVWYIGGDDDFMEVSGYAAVTVDSDSDGRR